MILSALGTTIIALALAWLLGGLVLRVGGALIALAGVLGLATTGDANGPFLLLAGLAAWFAGHWHYALRHQEFKAPLARVLFSRAPAGHRSGDKCVRQRVH